MRLQLVINPAAGGGLAMHALPKVEAALSSHEVLVTPTRSLEHADVLVAAAVADDRVVVAMGGDGIVGRVAGAVAVLDGLALGMVRGRRQNRHVWRRHALGPVRLADRRPARRRHPAATSRLAFLRDLPRVFKGTHVDLPSVSVSQARSVVLDADRPFRVFADGDPVATLPCTVTVKSTALKVLIPA